MPVAPDLDRANPQSGALPVPRLRPSSAAGRPALLSRAQVQQERATPVPASGLGLRLRVRIGTIRVTAARMAAPRGCTDPSRAAPFADYEALRRHAGWRPEAA
jgi:hypothetical protein